MTHDAPMTLWHCWGHLRWLLVATAVACFVTAAAYALFAWKCRSGAKDQPPHVRRPLFWLGMVFTFGCLERVALTAEIFTSGWTQYAGATVDILTAACMLRLLWVMRGKSPSFAIGAQLRQEKKNRLDTEQELHKAEATISMLKEAMH